MKRITALLALAATLTTAGCLQKDTTSTMYLRQDGSLDWVVFERNVRSDEADAARRTAEESAYLDAVGRDQHGVAEAFRALGGRAVRTRLLRDTRPYAVVVDAQFDSLTDLVDRQLAGCGVPYEVGSTREGSVTTWRLQADVGPDGSGLDGDECGAALNGLLGALDVTIVLESGTFIKATGFKLQGSDMAMLDDAATSSEALKKNDGHVLFSLSWTAGR